ncbi:DUF2157 domain-containing protein [Persicitalea jodogahamensis]|uniref:DUF2157 domain-containing protein n=1 Tax=Persicitalea jodogahamensis TaxID=402147 RepID=A0A8J3D7C7_9BACT|nr:DUF2157 domain-containing protein [Persicitalea jodogahamensis]GHB60998.1 hypothetical protein GCM10007390_13430 [Persicitalea jodogahamensis]
MNKSLLLDELEQKGLLESERRVLIEEYEKRKPVSLFVFLRTLLYVSISAFVGGVGVLIYQNIDTIGHSVLIGLIALATAGSFFYVFKNGVGYRPEKVEQSAPYFDVVLLLGCLLFLALEGYLQYQYELFGTRYGLAVMIPAIYFFFLAYRFDHQGVLSLAITALASWVGLTATPSKLLVENDFSDPEVIRNAIIFGVVMLVGSWLLKKQGIKAHFMYTYVLLAGTLYLLACLGGMFNQERWELAFGLLLGVGCWYFYKNALEEKSLLFLLLSTVFAYTGITYLLFNTMFDGLIDAIASLYFLATAAGIVWFFLTYKKILGKK